MPDSSTRNLGLPNNFSTDDELKVGALVDGLAAGSATRTNGTDGALLHADAGDLTFTLDDRFSLTFNIDHVLSRSFDGGNEAGFNVVQANSLADQDRAYTSRMNDNHGDTNLDAVGAGTVHGLDATCDWDLKVDNDLAPRPSAETTAIGAHSDAYYEIVQGANLLSNVANVGAIGDDIHATSAGQDSDVD